MMIILATYQHKHGNDQRAFSDGEGAEAWRQEIAETYWGDIMDGDVPADLRAAADAYFQRSEEMGDEYFNTECLEVEGLKVDA